MLIPGLIVFMRKGAGVRIPLVDRIRSKMGINPNSTTEYARALITKDRGITQLYVTLHEETMNSCNTSFWTSLATSIQSVL